MTDRNQEVIVAEIAKLIEAIKLGNLLRTSSKVVAFDLYAHIAPLIRGEFPQEAYQKVIDDAWCRGHNYVAAPTRKDPDWENTEDLLEEAKRIWEGRELPREGDNILEQDCPTCGGSRKVPIQAYEPDYIPEDEEGEHWKVCPDCKVTCQKCGGSGEIPYPGIVHHASGIKNSIDDCPQCAGTGVCKHKGGLPDRMLNEKPCLPVCIQCGEKVERRSGDERREGKERISNIPHNDGQPASVYEQVVHMGQLWRHARPNRRTKDRRKAG